MCQARIVVGMVTVAEDETKGGLQIFERGVGLVEQSVGVFEGGWCESHGQKCDVARVDFIDAVAERAESVGGVVKYRRRGRNLAWPKIVSSFVCELLAAFSQGVGVFEKGFEREMSLFLRERLRFI